MAQVIACRDRLCLASPVQARRRFEIDLEIISAGTYRNDLGDLDRFL